MISWVHANSRQLVAGCHPLQHGCNETMTERPLYGCVEETPIDLLIPDDGVVEITAKIPDVVDECRYNGNLLSGVASMKCLVRQKPPPPTAAPPPPVTTTPFPPPPPFPDCTGGALLQCSTRGC